MDQILVFTITFLHPVALVMALVLCISILRRRHEDKKGHLLLMGAMFSLCVVMSMSDPIDLGKGGIHDMRGLLIGTGTALLGPVVGGMALVAGLAMRWSIGGFGMVAGFVAMLGAFAGGLLWRFFFLISPFAQWKKSLLMGALISLHLVGIFVFPREIWMGLVTTMVPYYILANLVGAALISYLLGGELSFLSEAEASRINANTDHLTGLMNRRGLELAYPDLYAKAVKQKGQALLYFDIDKFKVTNDNFGHAVGDEVLKHVVELISANLRHQDVFVRLGGDEFAIILADITEAEGEAISERCRAVVAEAGFDLESEVLPVTISVGGIWTRHPVSIDRLLQSADTALFEAKSKGRNAVVYLSHKSGQLASALSPSVTPVT